MGIVEQELAEFELSDGSECRIELNRTGMIHVHVHNVRLDMSPEEFEHFADVVGDARRKLIRIKELDR